MGTIAGTRVLCTQYPARVTKVASTFGDMTPQIMQTHKTSAYYTDKNGDEMKFMEGETPFSPIGRSKMSYDISDTNADDDDAVIEPTIEYDRNAKGKGKSKGKAKDQAKGKKKWVQKDPEYMVIPPFGAAVAHMQFRCIKYKASRKLTILTR